jgi:hypothetical protein
LTSITASSAVVVSVIVGFGAITILSKRFMTFRIHDPACSFSKIFSRSNRRFRSLFFGNIPDTARRRISPVPCR